MIAVIMAIIIIIIIIPRDIFCLRNMSINTLHEGDDGDDDDYNNNNKIGQI